MPRKYPLLVFAPNGGATFTVHLNESVTSLPLPTPMPATRADGRLAPPWRWGGHQIDQHLHCVHFTFVNRQTNEDWYAEVAFGQTVESRIEGQEP